MVLILPVIFCGCGSSQIKGDKHLQTFIDSNTAAPQQQAPLPLPSGGAAISVAGESIVADEIIEEVREKLAPLAKNYDYPAYIKRAEPILNEALAGRIGRILLYKKARHTLPENFDEDTLTKAVDSEVKKFESRFGSNKALVEQALKKMGLDWKSFRQEQEKMLLSYSYMNNELPDEPLISHSELLEYYEKVKNEQFTTQAQLQFAVIDIRPEKLVNENTDANQAVIKAVELAAELKKRIDAGEDFGELAGKYSNDHRASQGGVWEPVRPGSLAAEWAILETTAMTMEPNQTSEPIAGDGHVFLLKLLKKQADYVEPFEKVQNQLTAQLRLEIQRKNYVKLMEKVVRQADTSKADKFLEYMLEKSYEQLAFE